MKVPKGQPHPLVAKLLIELGNVMCEECSVPNWKVYHTKEYPCPKRHDAAPQRSSEEKP